MQMRKLLLLLTGVVFFATQALAQQRTITGKVTDDKGSGVADASVVVKGTTLGTTTKADGTYSIAVPATATTLIFSAVGMPSMEVAIGKNTVVNAALKSEEKALSEVVVTSLGIRRDKKSLVYNPSVLKGEELNVAHTTNVTNALAGGKVPGLRVQGSGGSFTGSSIIIRGFTTMTGSNQPLFVIDGIPVDNSGGGSPLQNGPSVSNRLIDINPDDIESMTVLKGGSATVLYGSRGANGIILITTKKGKSGSKNSIQYSSTYSIENVNRTPDYQNEYAQGNSGVFSAVAQTSWGPRMVGQSVSTAYDPITNTNTRTEVLKAYPNNVTDMFRGGINWQNNLSFSGGSDKSTFRFSYGHNRNTGVLQNNVLTRHNFSLNASSKVNNYLTVTASGTYAINNSRRSQQGNQLSNPLFRGWFTPRSYDLSGLAFEDAAGNQRYPLGEDNPYWTLKHNRYRDEINRFIGNVGLDFRLNSWLNFNYKIGTDVYSTFTHGYDQIGARGGANTSANAVGGIRETRANYRSINSNAYLIGNKKLGNWNITGIVGNEFTQVYTNFAQLDGKGIIVRDFEQLANTTTFSPAPGNSSAKSRIIGLYGDFSFGYKNIFTFNVTGRNDWASVFKPGLNSYFYPGGGVSLNVTELFPETKSKVLENLKFRFAKAKLGKAGNILYGTDSYFAGAASADGFGPTISFPFNGQQAFTLSNAAGNPLLGPEFTTNTDFGIDLSLFKGRLVFDFTKYKNLSTGLIFGVPNSATAGITSVTQNAGNITTRGVELGVNIIPVKAKEFSWTVDVNYTQFKSVVGKLAPGVSNIFLGGFTTPNIRLVEGDEYGQIYGNAYQRDTKTGKIIVGANGLPLITSGVQKIGNPNPKYQLGITNTFTFKTFTLSFLLDYKKGGDQYSRNLADLQRNGVAIETAEFPRYDAAGVVTTPYLFDAVYANGQPNTTYVSAQNYFGNSGKYAAAEGFIYNTTWFRVREASVSYRLPSELLRKTPFGNAELSVFGRNLFLNSPNYPHLDPEQNALGISNAQGLEFNALPQTRTMGMGLKLSF
jgi:TonB-linked SusC/RagA family outer membrane protein